MNSCSEEIDINAEYQDIWVVYGVLHLEDSLQHVRISKAFQIEEDALNYANKNDPTIQGLSLKLEGGGLSLIHI